MLEGSLAAVRAFLESEGREAAAAAFSTAAVARFPPVAAAAAKVGCGSLGCTARLHLGSTPGASCSKVSWSALFPDASRAVKVEVGAGTGDWVALRAEADAATANWAALELRHDRACLIRAKGAMRGLRNLAVLAGDAHGILSGGLPLRSVAEVHVNFPQPPQSEGSERHLVNRAFLEAAHAILQPGGMPLAAPPKTKRPRGPPPIRLLASSRLLAQVPSPSPRTTRHTARASRGAPSPSPPSRRSGSPRLGRRTTRRTSDRCRAIGPLSTTCGRRAASAAASSAASRRGAPGGSLGRSTRARLLRLLWRRVWGGRAGRVERERRRGAARGRGGARRRRNSGRGGARRRGRRRAGAARRRVVRR